MHLSVDPHESSLETVIMSDIVTTERQTYSDMWTVPAYSAHSPGEMMVPVFLSMLRRTTMSAESVLDAGCGSGKGALALRDFGFKVSLCDITDEGLDPEARLMPFERVVLWEDLRQGVGFHDYVYCCDVMEHIPPTFAMLVVSRLLEVARSGVFFSISFVPDTMGAWIGKPLHQTLQSFVDWRDQLSTVSRLVEARDMLNAGAFLVEPR